MSPTSFRVLWPLKRAPTSPNTATTEPVADTELLTFDKIWPGDVSGQRRLGSIVLPLGPPRNRISERYSTSKTFGPSAVDLMALACATIPMDRLHIGVSPDGEADRRVTPLPISSLELADERYPLSELLASAMKLRIACECGWGDLRCAHTDSGV